MQTVHHCNEHDNCTVIIAGNWPTEPGSWCSHMDNDIPAEVRLSLDAPEAEDHRG